MIQVWFPSPCHPLLQHFNRSLLKTTWGHFYDMLSQRHHVLTPCSDSKSQWFTHWRIPQSHDSEGFAEFIIQLIWWPRISQFTILDSLNQQFFIPKTHEIIINLLGHGRRQRCHIVERDVNGIFHVYGVLSGPVLGVIMVKGSQHVLLNGDWTNTS